MHIGDSNEEARFRDEARAWLAEHAPAFARAGSTEDVFGSVESARRWQRHLAEHGWAGITWPTAFGGRGGTPIEATIFAEEMNRYAVSNGSFSVAAGMVGPTLIAHGTPDQRERHLGPILRGEDIWCQLFSEPGSGSDLASLATRAVRDGEEWVVNGQKVWTSLGQHSQWGILLARTDPDAPKHRGITYFLVDMSTPGIEVRPLRQITGAEHFNEVFLSDVRIPAANVVGEVGEGWRIAQTTLSNERALIGGGSGAWSVEQLIALAQANGSTTDPTLRDELAAAVTRARILQFLGYRLRTAMSQRRLPGAEALVLKLAYARHVVATTATAMRVRGASGMLTDAEADAQGVTEPNNWVTLFVGQYAVRIGGGTDEIQSNIIAEVGLGLPREPNAFRDTPWKDLPKA